MSKLGGMAGWLRQHPRQRVLLNSVAAERSILVADLIRWHLPVRARALRGRHATRVYRRYESYVRELEALELIWVRDVPLSNRIVASATMRGRNALCRLRAFERQQQSTVDSETLASIHRQGLWVCLRACGVQTTVPGRGVAAGLPSFSTVVPGRRG
ncbi:hypothetical protein, partial [Nocardia nova]|uniref:hypothetical protein n=1 Tax=Nocardia nova TaxID=37330 RepID=UPI001CA58710